MGRKMKLQKKYTAGYCQALKMVHNECIAKRRNGICHFEPLGVTNYQSLQANPVSFPPTVISY